MKKYRLISFDWADTNSKLLTQQEEYLDEYAEMGYVVDKISIGQSRSLIVMIKKVVKDE